MERARDGLIAVAVAAILLFDGQSSNGVAAIGYPLLAATGLILVARNRFPVAVLIGTAAGTAGYQWAGFEVFAVAFLVAVYSSMRAGHRRATLVTSLVLLATLPGAAMLSGAEAPFARARAVL